jgi:hypothetical protein
MVIQRASTSAAHASHQATEVQSSKGYRVLHDSRTVSKSAQSKIKNLAYTLSTPFRALVKQIIQNRTDKASDFNPMTNIKSPASQSSPAKEIRILSTTGESVEVSDICDTFTRQSLFGKIFG